MSPENSNRSRPVQGLIVPTGEWATDAEAFHFIHETAKSLLRGEQDFIGLHAIRQVAHLCQVRAERRNLERQACEGHIVARVRRTRQRLDRAWKAFIAEYRHVAP